MPRKTVPKEFGPLKVLCTQLLPTKALSILPEVAEAFLPIVPHAGRLKLSEGESFTVEDFIALVPGLQAVAGVLLDKKLLRLAVPLFSSTIVIVTPEGATEPVKYDLADPSNIDRAFQDNAMQLLPALRFAMEVTFKDFFPSLAATTGESPKAPASSATSPTTTGRTG